MHLFGDSYTGTSSYGLGGFLTFSAPGVFEVTHTRFGAFLCKKDDAKEAISSAELAHAERREDLLA